MLMYTQRHPKGKPWKRLPEALRWCYLEIHVIYTELVIEPSLGEALRFNFRAPVSYTHPSGFKISS